jgi:Ran GTPase-activating protein (RanGAP) involved in mRNA processing and transport
MGELSPLAHGTDTIYRLIANNLDSPVLTVIQHLSLSKLNTTQMAALLPALAKMTGLTSLLLPQCQASPDHLKFLFTQCPALSKLQSLGLRYVGQLRSEDLLVLSRSTTLTRLTSLNLSGCQLTTSRAAADPQNDNGVVTSDRFDNVEGQTSDPNDRDVETDSLFTAIGSDATNPNDGGIEAESNNADVDLSGGESDFEAKATGFYHGDFHHTDANNDDDAGCSGLVALLLSPVVQNLTHLDLSRTYFVNPLILMTIATSPFLSNLVFLDISQTKVNADAVAALASSTTLIQLTHLRLGDVALSPQLFSQPSRLTKNLQSIDLSNTFMTGSSLKDLITASPHLTELILAGNKFIGAAGAKLIATHMPTLTKLDLSLCYIGADGYQGLAESNTLKNLRELNLNWNHAWPPESIITLVNSPALVNLTHLDLGDTHDGPAVLAAIAQSTSLSQLQHLILGNNQVGNQGAIALAQSTTLANLISLDLTYNRIGPEGVQALCTSPVVSKLTSLNLSLNKNVDNSVASILAAPSSTLYSLLELNLQETEMGDDGVFQLLSASNLDQLDALYLSPGMMKSSTQETFLDRFDDHSFDFPF